MKRFLPVVMILGCLFALTPSLQAAPTSGPHGGTLVPIGEHFAFLEIVHSPLTGVLRVYVLDREAKGSIPLRERSLHLKVRNSRRADGTTIQLDSLEVELNPVTNASTGETVGNTSEFAGQSNALVGANQFEGLLQTIRVWGVQVRVIRFDFP